MDAARQKTATRAPEPPAPAVIPVACAITPRVQLQGTRISSPSDPAEKEADSTARRIMRMEAPSLSRFAESARLIQKHEAGPVLARQAEGGRPAPASVVSDLAAGRGGGSPLPPSVRGFMEPRFRADFSNVRVHTDSNAAQLARQVSAQAFTYGSQIYFGQNRFRPETSEGRELIAHELTHTIQQGAATQQHPPLQRSEDVTVTQQSPPSVQRVFGIELPGIDTVLNFFADAANAIPGWRMFTIVLGVNPINMRAVDRGAANILRAVVEFMPGGNLITRALDAYGVFDKAGTFVEQQLKSLGLNGAALQQELISFLKSLNPTSLLNPSGVWENAKSRFSNRIESIKRFVSGLAGVVVDLIKDALLRPLGALASKLPMWDLLCAVLGKNPITGEAVPRDADTLLGGFMKLIGQEELWQNLKKANAVQNAFAWFQTAMSELLGFVQQIPGLFLQALKALQIADIVQLPTALARVASVFGNFGVRFVSWAGNTIWNLLQIIFEAVAPSVMPYLRKAAAAFKSILKNPMGFVGNLVRAAKLGFLNFAANTVPHLKAGLLDWLTGSLSGVYIPKALTLPELGKLALSVLGITWAQIRAKIVKALGPRGEMIMKGLETAFDIVVALVRGGPAAAWEIIKDKLAGLRDTVLGGIINFVVESIVQKAIPKLIAMFVPGAGFISAIVSIYDTITVFIQKLSKIMQVVAAFIDSLSAIANGAVGAAAARVERILASMLSLAISFLAGFLGLGKVTGKVMEVINKVRATVDKALDAGIAWIVSKAKQFGERLVQAGVPKDPHERLKLGKEAALSAVNRFAGRRVGHAILKPLLAVIKSRYGFVRLDVVPRQGTWHVIGQINPDFSAASGVLTPESLTPGEGGRTLLIGEGNFSFGLSIALKTRIGGAMVATDYVVEERAALAKPKTEQVGLPLDGPEVREVRDRLTRQNIEALERLGVKVELQVDATDPTKYPNGQFDVIVFNHPFASYEDEQGKRYLGVEKSNIELIRGFLTAAKQRLSQGGKIVIISSKMRLQRWRIDQVAEQLGLEQKIMDFLVSEFPLYRHERTVRRGSAKSVGKTKEFAIILTVKSSVRG